MKTGKITKQHSPAPQDPSETTPRGEQHNKKIARGENQKEDEEVAAKIEDKEAVRANVDEASSAGHTRRPRRQGTEEEERAEEEDEGV